MERLAYDSSGQGLALLSVLDDLSEPFAVDVGIELHSQREVVGELIGEFIAGVVLVGEQLLDEGVAAEEIEDAAVVGEAFLERGQMQDLIVAGVLAEVGAANDLIAGLEVHGS